MKKLSLVIMLVIGMVMVSGATFLSNETDKGDVAVNSTPPEEKLNSRPHSYEQIQELKEYMRLGIVSYHHLEQFLLEYRDKSIPPTTYTVRIDYDKMPDADTLYRELDDNLFGVRLHHERLKKLVIHNDYNGKGVQNVKFRLFNGGERFSHRFDGGIIGIEEFKEKILQKEGCRGATHKEFLIFLREYLEIFDYYTSGIVAIGSLGEWTAPRTSAYSFAEWNGYGQGTDRAKGYPWAHRYNKTHLETVFDVGFKMEVRGSSNFDTYNPGILTVCN